MGAKYLNLLGSECRLTARRDLDRVTGKKGQECKLPNPQLTRLHARTPRLQYNETKPHPHSRHSLYRETTSPVSVNPSN